MKTNSQQQELGFGVAEGLRQERKAILALCVVKCRDIYLSRFLKLIFEATHGGQEGLLVKSYEELAEDPWGLCCDIRTARRRIDKIHKLGLIEIEERCQAHGGYAAHGYRIHWDGVRRFLGLPTPQKPFGQSDHTLWSDCPPPMVNLTIGYGQSDHSRSKDNALARGSAQTDIPHTVKPTTTVCEDQERIRAQVGTIIGSLWPDRRSPIRDIRDQRLLFRLAVLGLDDEHGEWVARLIEETAEGKPKKPLAYLQVHGPSFVPAQVDFGRLLKSIRVPRWALCDLRSRPQAPHNTPERQEVQNVAPVSDRIQGGLLAAFRAMERKQGGSP